MTSDFSFCLVCFCFHCFFSKVRYLDVKENKSTELKMPFLNNIKLLHLNYWIPWFTSHKIYLSTFVVLLLYVDNFPIFSFFFFWDPTLCIQLPTEHATWMSHRAPLCQHIQNWLHDLSSKHKTSCSSSSAFLLINDNTKYPAAQTQSQEVILDSSISSSLSSPINPPKPVNTTS